MKKGSFILSSEMMLWIPRFILLILVVLSVFFVVSTRVSKQFEIKGIENKLLTERYLNSESCLVYKDLRVEAGIIDLNKLTNENLDKCLYKENFAGNLTLMYNNLTIIKTSANRRDFLIENEPLCFSDRYYCKDKLVYVLYYDNGIKNGLLKIRSVLRLK